MLYNRVRHNIALLYYLLTGENQMKPWYESKMVWVGVATVLLGVIPLVQEMIAKGPIDVNSVLTVISGAIVVILRVWTNSPIEPIEK
jgi:hypothetical protein